MPEMIFNMEARTDENNVGKIYLYDSIKPDQTSFLTGKKMESSTSAERFRNQIEEMKDCKEIEIYIASNGGDVRTGLAIYSQLTRLKCKKTAYIDGMAASIATVIPMACDEIVMYSVSRMMIHNACMEVFGNSSELRKAADDLDVISASAKAAYLEKSGGKLEEKKLTEMMDKETWLTAEQCLEYGLCDRIEKSAPKSGAPEQYSKSQILMQAGNDELISILMEKLDNLRNMIYEMKKNDDTPPPEKNEVPAENEMKTDYGKFINAFVNGFGK